MVEGHGVMAFSDQGINLMLPLAHKAREVGGVLAQSSLEKRNNALQAAAFKIRDMQAEILAENAKDIAAFTGNAAMRDRLLLTPERIEVMARGLEEISALPDPLNRILEEWERPNGLRIRKVTMPVGVLGIIYESRPNVGIDASGLAIKSGNAILLRGGSDSFHSASVLHKAVVFGLEQAGLPTATVQIAPNSNRERVKEMLHASGMIDLIIPRGGKSLVEFVLHESRVPVLAHAEGLCHTYIHTDAELDMARKILLNAKMRRVGICGATETLLIDEAIAPSFLPVLVEDLRQKGCGFRADKKARALVPGLTAATEQDFATEWLDSVLSIAVVSNIEEALQHIARYGSSHTEAIVTQNEQAAQQFLNATQSAVAMWNASTQFCDGGEFGFGAEIGISTGRLHARGPVGVNQLTTFRYHVIGHGQTRP
ncbi:glutamate-5-semialdehyde dehydrogenase [Entomobacter blattae]|uniref:Gamma-glutamyl phosphate reductase n=1 Tax=Entomobacter blattae TaxID=2762277 RepID=A0A7H1NQ97_9PROT|nr:glutamate-5-semialdehyde dehydrogenase [Entomobacter blattae]QNT77957.1 Gamma-glutamyl phosphate reductase [Entomobacter blattae]